MSIQAINWALEDAPDVPSHLVAVLVALANHADASGRNAYVGQERLGWYTRKARRNVRKDIDALIKLGLIREGDQRIVAHLRADKRPTVYDLAMERKRERTPLDEGMHTSPRPQSEGIQASPREGMHTSPRKEVRGDAHVPSGGMPASPKPSTEPTSSSSSVSGPVARIASALEIEEEEARKVFNTIKTERAPTAPSRYVDHLIATGDISQFHRPERKPTTYSGPRCDFQPDRDENTCVRCGLPKLNPRHQAVV